MRCSRRLGSLTAAVALAGAVVAGCGGGNGGPGDRSPITVDSPSAATDFRGAVLDPPRVLPAVTLSDTSGRPWNLAQRARDRLTVVYFGYTNCPDVCPTDMADLATARRSVPVDVRSKLDIVFITVDLKRDKPPVLRRWLDRFDQSLVGLTGTPGELGAASRALGVPYRVNVTDKNLEEVEHGSLMTAFAPDGTSRLAWLDGTPPGDIAHDLQLLAAGQVPA